MEKGQSNKLECDFCDKSFSDEDCLSIHIVSLHKSIIEGQKTPYFDTSDSTMKSSNGNIDAHPKIDREQFQCDLCGKEFTRSFDLKRHASSVHAKKKNYTCDICNKVYIRKSHLTEHVEISHIERKRKFKCHSCERQFSLKISLNFHIKTIHNSNKDYTCGTCSKEFSVKKNLMEHLLIHEEKKRSQVQLM